MVVMSAELTFDRYAYAGKPADPQVAFEYVQLKLNYAIVLEMDTVYYLQLGRLCWQSKY
jgi:hypothetical protein